MAKKPPTTEAAPPPMPPVAPAPAPPPLPVTAAEATESGEVLPPPPQPPMPPEPPIKIHDEAAATSGIVQVPTEDVLKLFPPPPPIVARPTMPPEPPIGMPPGVFPLAPPGQQSHQPHTLPPPVPFIEAPKPAPVRAKRFAELPDRTKAEIASGWERTHPGQVFDPAVWEEPLHEDKSVSATEMQQREEFLRRNPPPGPKLTDRTKAEMEAGRQRLADRNGEFQKVMQRQAEKAAEALERGDLPAPDAMNYIPPGGGS